MTTTRRGLSLLSSLIYDHPRDFRCAIDLVSSGTLHPGRHVRAVVDLADASATFSRTAPGKTVFDLRGVLEHQPCAAP